MKITAYSDGSFYENDSIAVSILRTSDTFVGMVVGSQRVGTAYDAELIGILQVLEYIEENDLEYEKLTIYTDVKVASDIFATIKETGIVPEGVKARKKWLKIRELTKDKKVFIFHYKGHAENNNTNKTCDIAARLHRVCSTDS